MRKLTLVGVVAAAAAAAAYLFDPDRGRSRRARLSDQAVARARDVSETVKAKVEYQKGVAKGVVHEVTEPFRAEKEYDDQTLLQKVRSEALGRWPWSDSIEIDITDGNVTINGTVETTSDRERLLDLIRDVDGIGMVDDRLEVRS
ncbi:MAG TPA: BON domain-containing protein [Acidimicrobiia bacterium]|nr:BON domain-containing protein [Acidimicrobiia bacterium]